MWSCHTLSVPKNLSRTAHVAIPVDVVADIDKLVGKRSRSAFLTELAQREIKIRGSVKPCAKAPKPGNPETIPNWLRVRGLGPANTRPRQPAF